MVQYVSPTLVVLEAISKMSAQNLPLQVFQSQAICNILGISYGIQIHNSAVLVTNLFGLGRQSLYLASDHYIRSSNVQWPWLVTRMAVSYNIGLYFFSEVSSITMLGHMITIFNVILFAAPLAKLGTILQTRNASSLPTAMICISVLNNGVWTLFAILLDDMVLLLPSVLGYMLSAFQVLVILWCQGFLAWDLAFLLAGCRDRGPQKLRVDEQELEEGKKLLQKTPSLGKKKDSETELAQLGPECIGQPALAG